MWVICAINSHGGSAFCIFANQKHEFNNDILHHNDLEKFIHVQYRNLGIFDLLEEIYEDYFDSQTQNV